MSRAYRIAVSESLARHVRVEDGVCASLEILPVLPREKMSGILMAELAQRGFVQEGNTARRKDKDGVEVTVDLEEGSVTVRLAREKEVNLEIKREARVDERMKQSEEERLRASVRGELERDAQREEKKLTEEVARKLEGKLRDLRQELDQVSNRVTASALKVRASQLGQIEEIHEEPDGSMTIKVKL